MKRKLHDKLLEWRDSRDRKPLLLKGVRQVGKTYLLKDFGEGIYKACHHFNFEKDKKLSKIFETDLFPRRIVDELAIHSGKKIDISTDLVIFDEIQECPRALTSLKYFCEEMPNLALCAAGSLLGVKLSGESFPVGKVEFLHLYPMNFEEFIMANEDEMSLEIFKNALQGDTMSEIAHLKLWSLLKEYYITGGMPKAVLAYLETKNDRFGMMDSVRKVQRDLLDSYHKDFAKHSGKVNAMHIVSLFENVPMQLAKTEDNSAKRFEFKNAIPGKRGFADLHGPIDWLEKAGLVIMVKVCNRAEIPLESFCKYNMFKLFVFDIGLLGCMLEIPPESLISEDYGMTKGYFAENFTACEFLAATNANLYSWAERNSEIEFLRVLNGKIVPVEVKSGLRTQAKSLRQYILKYHPSHAIKLSANRLNKGASQIVQNYPLYLAGLI